MLNTIPVPEMTGLWRVRSPRVLLWPEKIMNAEMTRLNARGKAGYVVDFDQPYEKVLCFGCGKFFERVPEDEIEAARELVQDPQDFPRPILNFLADKKLVKRTPTRRGGKGAQAVQKRNEEKRAASEPAPGTPALDSPPKGGRTRRSRKREEEGDAAQGDTSPAGA